MTEGCLCLRLVRWLCLKRGVGLKFWYFSTPTLGLRYAYATPMVGDV